MGKTTQKSKSILLFPIKLLFNRSSKSIRLLLGFIFIFTINTNAQTTIDFENFESGWGDWVAYSGSNCSLDNSSQISGNWSVELNDDKGDDSAMYIDLDLSSYGGVSISFDFKKNNKVKDDGYLHLKYYNGSTWTTIASYQGIDYNENQIYSSTVNIDDTNPTNY